MIANCFDWPTIHFKAELQIGLQPHCLNENAEVTVILNWDRTHIRKYKKL